ncbi:MAG: hypothetical protein JXQ90_18460 [Cyclobacteriaceae bacterium]
MVRIIQQPLPKRLPKKFKSFFELLGVFIVDYPDRVVRLLNKHAIPVSPKASGQEMIGKLINAFEVGNKAFQTDLSKMLESEVAEPNDSFVGAIAGAVGSVAGVFGAKQQAKAARAQSGALKDQARQQTLQAMLAYKASKETQQAMDAQSGKAQLHQEKMLKLAGAGIAIAIVGWYLISQQTKSVPPSVTRNTIT